MRKLKTRIATVGVSAVAACGAAAAPALAVDQDGLVNVAVVDVLNNNTVVANVQVPVAIAANVCDVNVNVLARQLDRGETTCEADAQGAADAQNIIQQLERTSPRR